MILERCDGEAMAVLLCCCQNAVSCVMRYKWIVICEHKSKLNCTQTAHEFRGQPTTQPASQEAADSGIILSMLSVNKRACDLQDCHFVVVQSTAYAMKTLMS